MNFRKIFVIDENSGNISALVGRDRVQALPEEEIMKLLIGFPETQMKVADHSLSLEKIIDTPVDIEWAMDKDGGLYLVQVRPLQRRAAIEVLELKPEQILIKTSQVIGCFEKEFNHVILISRENFLDIKEFLSQYPSSLIILAWDVTQETESSLMNNIFPFIDCLVFIDESPFHHVFGTTTLDHFSLNVAESGKAIIFPKSIPCNILQWPKTTIRGWYSSKVDVYHPLHPIRVAVDDANGVGIVYCKE